MPFTLFHGLLSYLIVRRFSKSIQLRRISFLGGIAPDLDGLPLLWSYELYKKIHHTLLHPPFYGIVFGAICSFLFFLYCKKKNQSFNFFHGLLIFFFSFFLHSLLDIFVSSWKINFFFPFGELWLGLPSTLPTLAFLALTAIVSIPIVLISIYAYTKDKSFFTELFPATLIKKIKALNHC